jgi:hypothetical protein
MPSVALRIQVASCRASFAHHADWLRSAPARSRRPSPAPHQLDATPAFHRLKENPALPGVQHDRGSASLVEQERCRPARWSYTNGTCPPERTQPLAHVASGCRPAQQDRRDPVASAGAGRAPLPAQRTSFEPDREDAQESPLSATAAYGSGAARRLRRPPAAGIASRKFGASFGFARRIRLARSTRSVFATGTSCRPSRPKSTRATPEASTRISTLTFPACTGCLSATGGNTRFAGT